MREYSDAGAHELDSVAYHQLQYAWAVLSCGEKRPCHGGALCCWLRQRAASVTGLGLATSRFFGPAAPPTSNAPPPFEFKTLEYICYRTWYGATPRLILFPDGKVDLSRTEWLTFHHESRDPAREPFDPKRNTLTEAELSRLRALVAAVNWNDVKQEYHSDGIFDGSESRLKISTDSRIIDTSVYVVGQAKEPAELTSLFNYVDGLLWMLSPPEPRDNGELDSIRPASQSTAGRSGPNAEVERLEPPPPLDKDDTPALPSSSDFAPELPASLRDMSGNGPK